jgi:hypothetical protein
MSIQKLIHILWKMIALGKLDVVIAGGMLQKFKNDFNVAISNGFGDIFCGKN